MKETAQSVAGRCVENYMNQFPAEFMNNTISTAADQYGNTDGSCGNYRFKSENIEFPRIGSERKGGRCIKVIFFWLFSDIN